MKKKKPAHSKPRLPERSSWAASMPLQATAVALLAFVAYSNSLGDGFHFDDQGIFLDPYVVSSGFGWKILRLMQTRPLTFLSFHWNYLAGGSAPAGYHWINILLHAANSVLVTLIARRHIRGFLPLIAGALFAVHPLQTQAVNYVFERATLLAAFFALLSFFLFLHERYYLSVIAFGLSLLAKEETIALPAFLLLYDIVYRRWRIRGSYYTALLGVAGIMTVRLFYVLHTIPEIRLGFGTKGIPAISYALTECRVVWVYLRLFLLPVGLSLDHDVKLSQGLFSPLSTFPALLLLMLLIGALAWLAWRGSEPAFWALGFFVLLSPSSSVIPVIDLMFEHRTYFPLLCMVVAVVFLMARLPARLRAPVSVVLIAALLAGTMVRNGVWHDEQSLWTDVVEKSPGKARGYFQLGQVYASRDPARARQLYERGLEIEPGNPIGHTNLGLVLLSQNDPGAALEHLRRALDLGGDKALIWNNIGAAQLHRDEIDEGIKSFRKALESDPCRFDARLNLMRALSYTEGRKSALVAGQTPTNCSFLPEQARRLEDERRSLQ